MDIKSAVQRFEIGEPLKSLFKPRFRVSEDRMLHGSTRLDLVCFAPDAYGGPVIEINLQRIIDGIQNEERLFYEMRHMIHDMLLHEADEAILVDGRRVFDPHKR